MRGGGAAVGGIRDAEDDEHEHGGTADFHQHGAPFYDGRGVVAERSASGVGEKLGEDHGRGFTAGVSADYVVSGFEGGKGVAKEDEEQNRREHGPKELGDDVGQDFVPREFPPGRESEGDGGVEVSPADAAGELDREGDADAPDDGDLEDADLSAREHGRANRSTTEEHEQEGADEFGGAGLAERNS